MSCDKLSPHKVKKSLTYVRYFNDERSLIKAIDSVGDPPLPIPNREVKPDSADGTANICGRVGHRHFLKSTSVNSEVLFFVKLKGENGKVKTENK